MLLSQVSAISNSQAPNVFAVTDMLFRLHFLNKMKF